MHTTCPGKVTITDDTLGALIYPTPPGGREDTSIFQIWKLRLGAKEESSSRKGEAVLPSLGFVELLGVFSLIEQQTGF